MSIYDPFTQARLEAHLELQRNGEKRMSSEQLRLTGTERRLQSVVDNYRRKHPDPVTVSGPVDGPQQLAVRSFFARLHGARDGYLGKVVLP